jgi:hypothetical protein
MDNLMFRHAEKEGVIAFDETKVDSIEFENNGDPKTSRPIAANWTNKAGQKGRIAFDWLVDASGKAGVMSTQYLKNRVMRESFRNVAVWSYWKGIRATGRPFSFYAEVLTGKQLSNHLLGLVDLMYRRQKGLGMVYPPQRRNDLGRIRYPPKHFCGT